VNWIFSWKTSGDEIRRRMNEGKCFSIKKDLDESRKKNWIEKSKFIWMRKKTID
jgi:hypothetical protein